MLWGMALYDVVQQEQWPGPRGRSLEISAASPGEALVRARRCFELTGSPARGDAAQLYAVYRHRRVRGHRLVGVFGAPGPGGTAGVREPRRPLTDPPALSVAREVSPW
jgi:hypothetical protein